MLASAGVFCPPVKIGAEVFFVIDNWEPAFGEPVYIGADKVVDVSTRGVWLGTEDSGELVSWEELNAKKECFIDKKKAEAKYKELMAKYENIQTEAVNQA